MATKQMMASPVSQKSVLTESRSEVPTATNAINSTSTLQAMTTLRYSRSPLQRKKGELADSAASSHSPTVRGLPSSLKTGMEHLSGFAMDKVQVHYNSPEPAHVGALAFAQGTQIHLASGQERHLPHEAWHVVQQAQGRVPAGLQMKQGVSLNEDARLEQEADRMGAKALHAAAPLISAPTAPSLPPVSLTQLSGMPAVNHGVVQRTRSDAQNVIGEDKNILEVLGNTELNLHYRYTMLLINNEGLTPKMRDYLPPTAIPDLTQQMQKDRLQEDIKKSYHYRYLANPQFRSYEPMEKFETERDTILRVLYENNGFVALKGKYTSTDTMEKFGLSKENFDMAFKELWDEKIVRPSKDGLHLSSKGKISLVPSLGVETDLTRDRVSKIELFKQFNQMMDGLGIPVFLSGGAVANIALNSPRKLNDLDYRTLALEKTFKNSPEIVEKINAAAERTFRFALFEKFRVSGENQYAIDGVIDGVEITIANIINRDDFRHYQEPSEHMISPQDLVLDKAATFPLRKSDQKKITDLFDLLWGMLQLKMSVEELFALLDEKRSQNYARTAESDDTRATDIRDEFSTMLVDFVARGARSLHSLFLAEISNKKAIKQVEEKLQEFLTFFGIGIEESARPSLLIQAGNMTGDMFGVSAALLHNPLAQVLLLHEDSPRDQTKRIYDFYAQHIEKGRIHLLKVENMSDAYTEYSGRQKKILPMSKITPELPPFLRKKDRQLPVSDASTQVANMYSEQSAGLMKEKWQLGTIDPRKCKEFLQGRKIPLEKKYAILWSRFSGKRGGPHAQHDTSFAGMAQMINLARSEGYIVLLTGDAPATDGKMEKFQQMMVAGEVFNLIEFWKSADWLELFPDNPRSAQFALFEYLQQHGGVKHLGFRSGNLEAYSLIGQSVSYMEETGNLQHGRMEAWHGKKINYNRIQIDTLPSLTGRYVAEQAARNKREDKPEWITDPTLKKSTYLEQLVAARMPRGFMGKDLNKIHRYFAPDAKPEQTREVELMRQVSRSKTTWQGISVGDQFILKQAIQRLSEKEAADMSGPEIVFWKWVEKNIDAMLISAALGQGTRQEALTDALLNWQDYLYLMLED